MRTERERSDIINYMLLERKKSEMRYMYMKCQTLKSTVYIYNQCVYNIPNTFRIYYHKYYKICYYT